MDANDSFEIAAAAFRKVTGHLPPGKDVRYERPASVARDWELWCAAVECARAIREHATKCARCGGKGTYREGVYGEQECDYCDGTGKGRA